MAVFLVPLHFRVMSKRVTGQRYHIKIGSRSISCDQLSTVLLEDGGAIQPRNVVM
jgi:hypothetical protein